MHNIIDPKSKLGILILTLYNQGYHAGHHDTVEHEYNHIYPQDMTSYRDDIIDDLVDGAISDVLSKDDILLMYNAVVSGSEQHEEEASACTTGVARGGDAVD